MWRIYENSRVVFDLLERDLQASVVSSKAGQKIPFFMGAPDPNDQDNAIQLSFIASIDPPDSNATSRLCEITYRFHEDSNLTNPALVDSDNLKYTLYRQVVHNGPSTSGDWDFDTNPAWYQNNGLGSQFYKVVDGIQNLSIDFFFNSPVAHSVPAGGEVITNKPTSVRVTFDLYDAGLEDAPDAIKNQTLRGFYKDIDLKKF